MPTGIKQNRNCMKCKKLLDRVGFLCQSCYEEGLVKARENSYRLGKKRSEDLKKIKPELYKKMLEEIKKELDKEESNIIPTD